MAQFRSPCENCFLSILNGSSFKLNEPEAMSFLTIRQGLNSVRTEVGQTHRNERLQSMETMKLKDEGSCKYGKASQVT